MKELAVMPEGSRSGWYDSGVSVHFIGAGCGTVQSRRIHHHPLYLCGYCGRGSGRGSLGVGLYLLTDEQ